MCVRLTKSTNCLTKISTLRIFQNTPKGKLPVVPVGLAREAWVDDFMMELLRFFRLKILTSLQFLDELVLVLFPEFLIPVFVRFKLHLLVEDFLEVLIRSTVEFITYKSRF